MNPKTETETIVVETPAVSTKRQVTGVVAATAVTVILGAVASVAIDKLSNRVKKAIVPETEATVVE